jgi:hypothetical protein
LANRLLLGRFALIGGCEVACSGTPAAWLDPDISGLLLLQQYLRGREIDEHKARKHERI